MIISHFHRLSFLTLKKAKTLFVVDSESESYPIKNSEFFNIRKIYFWYLIKNIYNPFSIKQKYLKSILEATEAKIIVSNNLNVFGYKFKEINPKLKYFTYQHSYIYDIEIENYKNLYRDIKIDYFFVFDQRHQNIFSKIIKSNFIKIGSFNNNFIKINENQKKQKQINYISEYRGKKQSVNSMLSEKKIIEKLHKFCSNYGYKLLISLNSNRIDKNIQRKKEINYFLNIEKNIIFNETNSYQNSYNSTVTIVMSSNMGIELLSRGIPTLYLNELQKKDKKFDNPYYKNFSNFFIDADLNDEEFAEKLLEVVNHKLKYHDVPIKYDKDNIEFSKILKMT